MKTCKHHTLHRLGAAGLAFSLALALIVPAGAAEGGITKEETVYVQADAAGQPDKVTVETALRNLPESDDVTDRTTLTDIKNSQGDEEFTQKSDGTLIWENHGADIQYEGSTSADLPVGVHVSYTLDGKSISPAELAGKSGHVTIRFDYENKWEQTVTVDGTEYTVKVPFAALSLAALDGEHFSNIEVTNGKLLRMDDTALAVGLALPGLADSLALRSHEDLDVDIPEYVEFSADVTEFELDFSATIFSPGLFADADFSDLDDVDDLLDSLDKLGGASSELVDGTAAFRDGLGEFQTYLTQYLTGGNALSTGAAQLSGGLNALDGQSKAVQDGLAQLTDGLGQLNDGLTGLSLPGQDVEDGSATAVAAGKLAQDAATLQALTAQLQSAAEQLGTYEAQVQSQTAAAQDALNSIDLTDHTALARRQVLAAGRDVLADRGLSEEEQEAILNQIADGVDLSDADADAQTRLDAAKAALAQMPQLADVDFAALTQSVSDAAADLLQQLSTITAHMQGMTSAMQTLPTLLAQFRQGVGGLETGAQQLQSGFDTYADAVHQLSEGASQLAEGAQTLTTAGSSLSAGFAALTDAGDTLADGMATFDREGIQELCDLGGDEFADLTARLRAVQLADQNCTNFAGIAPEMQGSVRFLFETAEIKP